MTALKMDANIEKAKRKGKPPVGKMHAILTDPHLDTKTEICLLMNMIDRTIV